MMLTHIILTIIVIFVMTVLLALVAYWYAMKMTSVEPIPAPPSYARSGTRVVKSASYSDNTHSTNDIKSNNSSSDN